MNLSLILLILFMLATVGILAVGIILMMTGGNLNQKYSNRLMMARVILQALALILLGALFAA